ncbi:MAG: DUF1801 domain-containing protein [Kineosporiaceae bacterium]|nr:DUF1801 domain-containing protein [Kineosporiaceae bacterium]MBK7621875.1 DUF1801 domain-containing protein [Kineosporiaceae bacterium]MBK8074182.1 DUF1801 domain-containing protein [Kineosporiaceae bacterium]
MAEPKTRPTGASVEDFLASVADPRRHTEARAVCDLMTEATGLPPEMWGDSIVGFGRHTYATARGESLEWPPVGFSPRKASLTVYLLNGFDRYGDLLAQLGPHTLGRACLYLKRLDAIDQGTLRELIVRSYRDTTAG